MTKNAVRNDSIPAWQPISGIVFIVVFAALFIWVSGDWSWTEGWIFVGLFISFSVVTSIWMYFRDPSLFRERYRSPIQPEQKSWDKFVIWMIFLAYLVWYFIMPLDARRYRWSPEFAFWLRIIGFVVTAFGFWMFFESFRENTFAAPVVKMQKERKQTVISTGLYGIVRHPLYSGAALMAVGAPLLVGSVYGILAGIIFAAVLATRSVGEERMLQAELEGYSEYMKRVRWRLFPLVF